MKNAAALMREQELRRRRIRFAIQVAALVTLVISLYGRTATFDFAYLDDDVLVLNDRPFLTAPSSITRAFFRPYFPAATGHRATSSYYRPLVTASYSLDTAGSGRDAARYHVTNVLVHALATVLVVLLLRRFSYRDDIAFFAAAVFAVHPALTEAVAWIPGRNDSLLAIFALTAWLLLPVPTAEVRGRSDSPDPPYVTGATDERPRFRRRLLTSARFAGHVLAWLAALFTKETALVLPAVWVAQRLWLERRSLPWRATVPPRLVAAWLGALVVYLGFRQAALATSVATAVGSLTQGSAGLMARLVFNLTVLISGLGKLLLPVHLSVLAIPEDSWLWPGLVGAMAVLLAARLLPGMRSRHLMFALGCMIAFVIPSVPASNILILENRLYLPAVGLALALAELASQVPEARPFVRLTGAAALVAGLAVASFGYSGNFRDRTSFAQAAVGQSPHSALAHKNLGVTFQLAGDNARARQQYHQALDLDAAEPIAHNNLGVIFMAQGRLFDAERELRAELAINANYAQAHHNLALVLEATGRSTEALKHRGAGILPEDNVPAP